MICIGNRWSNRHRWSGTYRNAAGELEQACARCPELRTGSKIPKHEREWFLAREGAKKK